jgi:hypothetical protein
MFCFTDGMVYCIYGQIRTAEVELKGEREILDIPEIRLQKRDSFRHMLRTPDIEHK